MFADELTLGSFFRRLSFTADGAFLVVPAALWHGRRNNDDGGSDGGGGGGGGGGLSPGSPTSVLSGGVDRLADSSFATYLFARHHYDQPYKVLAGLEKVRACRAFHSIGEGK
jgi:chromatin assembly factor 1 subunit B